jgi:hypothetical protein
MPWGFFCVGEPYRPSAARMPACSYGFASRLGMAGPCREASKHYLATPHLRVHRRAPQNI